MSKRTNKAPKSLPVQHRAAKVESFDLAARTVTFALSSEHPVERWYGKEILDHAPTSIRQERLKAGMAQLINHDSNQHTGRVESYEISDKTLRVTSRFGNSDLASEKLQDVVDGILVDASVGYIVHGYKLDQSDDSGDTYRVIDWEPVEASLVAVPADPSVGVGRSKSAKATAGPLYPARCVGTRAEDDGDEDPCACDCTACADGNHSDCTTEDCDYDDERSAPGFIKPVPAGKEEHMTEAEKEAMRQEAARAERERVNEIHAVQREHAAHFTPEQAIQAVNDGANISEVRKSVLANQREAAKASKVRTGAPADQHVIVDEQDKRAPGITMARTVRALAFGKGDFGRAEKFASDVLKDQVVARSFASAAASAADGGYALQGNFSSEIIELLRPVAVVRSLGPNTVPLDGTYTQNRLLSGAAGGYIGENKDIPATKGSFGSLKLAAKKLAALLPISNDLLRRNGGASADAAVRDDLMISLANTEDISFIRANGTAYSPKGLRWWVLPANLIAASNGSTVALVAQDLGKLKLALRKGNIRFVRPGYMISPRTEYFLQNLLNGLGYPIYKDEMASGKLNGYPYRVTTQIPENLTVSAVPGCTEIYFADFADVTIGDAPQIGIEFSTEASYIDPTTGTLVSAFSQDQTVMRIIIEHDIGMRHQEGLAILNGVTWGQ